MEAPEVTWFNGESCYPSAFVALSIIDEVDVSVCSVDSDDFVVDSEGEGIILRSILMVMILMILFMILMMLLLILMMILLMLMRYRN